jgi:hypothetical protein
MALRLRIAPYVALAVALTAAAPFASAADTPPTNLKYVNGHWTAWDPPATFPEGAKVHIVVPGDTFWALAAENLGNPYLWPQLWEKNQYVLDAHWIYPGDPLVVGVGVATTSPVEPGGIGGGAPGGIGTTGATGGEGAPGAGTGGELTETEDVAAGAPGGVGGTGGGAGIEGGAGAGTGGGVGGGVGGGTGAAGVGGGGAAAFRTAPSGGARSVPMPLGAEDDIYCSGFVSEEEQSFPYRVLGSEYEVLQPSLIGPAGQAAGIYGTADVVKYKLAVGDLIYVDGGRSAGLAPGAVLSAVEPAQRIVHPVTKEGFGRQYNYRGRVRVLSVTDETAIAEIVQSCDGIRVGIGLRPFVPEPVPLARRTPLRPVNDPATYEALAGAPVILSHPVSLVSFGQDHVVFIDHGEDEDVLPGDLFTIYRTNKEDRPPVVVGELAILSVQRHTAVAKILESRYPIYAGDRLDRK